MFGIENKGKRQGREVECFIESRKIESKVKEETKWKEREEGIIFTFYYSLTYRWNDILKQHPIFYFF